MTLLLVLVNCVLLVSGQLLWKIGLENIRLSSIKDIIYAIFNPYIFGGLCIYGVATLVWFYILKNNELSKVYPLQSFSYILALLAGHYILQESITKNNVIGTLIIFIGVAVLYR